jgi:hypothetical protein
LLGLPPSVAVVCALAASGVFATGALASSPFSWSPPALIDGHAPFGSSAELTGVSCPSSTLCVAVDGVGKIATSTDGRGDLDARAGGRQQLPRWHLVPSQARSRAARPVGSGIRLERLDVAASPVWLLPLRLTG